MWYVLLTTMVGAALSFFAVVHLSSHESGTGAEETPRLPVNSSFDETKCLSCGSFDSLVLHPGTVTC